MLVLIHYIINYAIKRDCSKYHRNMAIAIIRNVFEDRDKPGSKPSSYTSNQEKFSLKAFNRLLYNCEICGLLVVEFLFDLLDHYTLNALIKSINIFVLKAKFIMLISRQNFNITNNVIYVNNGKIPSYSIFEDCPAKTYIS